MPKMNGYEAYLHMKEIRPDVVVLFNSGYIGEDQLDSFTKEKNISFLHKPYNTDTLLKKVDELITIH